jgi:lipoate-protein ligase A
MKLLDLTLDTPAENLALDEALLNEREQGTAGSEILRLWEPSEPMVVVGRASRVAEEVDRAACRARGIPILRRASGGAAIVAAPGCLMYSVVLGYAQRPALRMIQHAHQFVLGTMAEALRGLVPGVQQRGISDLALADDRKFSGNSLRCKRAFLLYHGTLLYDFPLELIDVCLAMPPRQPDYRRGRGHTEFVANLPLDREVLRRAVLQAWQPQAELTAWPRAATRDLVQARYTRSQWNDRL